MAARPVVSVVVAIVVEQYPVKREVIKLNFKLNEFEFQTICQMK